MTRRRRTTSPERMELPLECEKLLRRPGTRRDVRREVDAADLGLTDADVSGTTVGDDPLVLDVVVESTSGEALTATGTVSVPWRADCRRCLEEVSGTAVAEVREVFESVPTEGETYLLADRTIDLGPLVRDAALLSLPTAVVCSEDCLGPEPERFPATPEGVAGAVAVDADADGDDGERLGDPRWAVLDQLKGD
ncbi:MAG: YceD family protein [Actinomycetota bacterium]|nr:YceD family protein [Actinomycetota bacterium]